MRKIGCFLLYFFTTFCMSSFANSKVLILPGDIESLSLDSAQDLTDSMMEVMESFC